MPAERHSFYLSKRWRTIRDKHLFEQPVCEMCHERLAEALLSTCQDCHSIVQAQRSG